MNQRIKQLALQAKCYADENNAHYLQNPHWIETFEEKFAELIVRECVAICQDVDGEDNIDARSGRQDCAVEIKQHFGVEE
jgi:hypothetical protein